MRVRAQGFVAGEATIDVERSSPGFIFSLMWEDAH